MTYTIYHIIATMFITGVLGIIIGAVVSAVAESRKKAQRIMNFNEIVYKLNRDSPEAREKFLYLFFEGLPLNELRSVTKTLFFAVSKKESAMRPLQPNTGQKTANSLLAKKVNEYENRTSSYAGKNSNLARGKADGGKYIPNDGV